MNNSVRCYVEKDLSISKKVFKINQLVFFSIFLVKILLMSLDFNKTIINVLEVLFLLSFAVSMVAGSFVIQNTIILKKINGDKENV